MNMIDIKTNEAAIFSLYLNTRLMYGDKRYIEIIFLTVQDAVATLGHVNWCIDY